MTWISIFIQIIVFDSAAFEAGKSALIYYRDVACENQVHDIDNQRRRRYIKDAFQAAGSLAEE
jgi:hypothetical protein